jgi:hypothetical protein
MLCSVWQRNIDLLSISARLEKLVITLDFSWNPMNEDSHTNFSQTLVTRDLNKMIESMEVLKGRLKAFNVYLWRSPSMHSFDGELDQHARDAFERRLQSTLMGEEYRKDAGDVSDLPARYINGTSSLRMRR